MLFCCIVVVWYFAREYFRWARQVHGRGCGARNSASGVLVGSQARPPPGAIAAGLNFNARLSRAARQLRGLLMVCWWCGSAHGAWYGE